MAKRKQGKSKKYELLISSIVIIAVVFLSVGFAAFQTNLLFNNLSAIVRVQREIRVTNLSPLSSTNNAVMVWEDFDINNIYTSFSLPDEDSTVTYDFEVTNLGNAEAAVSEITGLPENLTYTLNDYIPNTMLCDDTQTSLCKLGSKTTISITIGYAENGYDGVGIDFAPSMEVNYIYLVDATAMVGNTIYNTMQAAINAVPDNTQTNVILLRSTAECVNVTANKNIVFNLSNFTWSNDVNLPVIWNYGGTITISNGTLSSDASTNGTFNNEDGNVTITGGRFINTGGRQAFYNNGGTALISGNPYFYNTTNQRAAVHNLTNSKTGSTGRLTITGGTIIAAGLYGVRNEATMVIGTQDGTPDKNAIVIQGYVDGVYSGGNFAFYDGIIKGRNLAINPSNAKASPIESGYSVISSEETIDGVVYQTAFVGTGIKITFNTDNGVVSPSSKTIEVGTKIGTLPTPSKAGFEFLGWFTTKAGNVEVTSDTTFNSATTIYAHWLKLPDSVRIEETGVMYSNLEDAIDAVTDSTPKTITIETDLLADIEIKSFMNITIDLNGHTLSNNDGRPIITTAGTLTIENGDLSTNANQAAINVTAGNTTIDNCSIIASGNNSKQAMYITGGSVTISGSSYLSSQASGTSGGMDRGTVQVMAGNLYVLGGTIVATNNPAISSKATVYIGANDGTINQSSPIIQGKTYGVKSTNKFYFYDGILKGQTGPYSGNITGKADNSTNPITGTETIGNATYNTAHLEPAV